MPTGTDNSGTGTGQLDWITWKSTGRDIGSRIMPAGIRLITSETVFCPKEQDFGRWAT
jgi:hypothetical protein